MRADMKDDNGCKVKVFKKENDMSSIDNTLNERGSRYGKFTEHSRITQEIKQCLVNGPNWYKLDDDMKESLEMIAHKIGRILNGDPNYDDNWRDIAGYSTLVLKRLNGDSI